MRQSTESTDVDIAIVNRGNAGGNAQDRVQAPPESVDKAGPEYWLNRAEEARRQAADITDRTTRREMLNIAAGYRRVAQLTKDETAEREPRRRRRR
jgi:hypothetical protein